MFDLHPLAEAAMSEWRHREAAGSVAAVATIIRAVTALGTRARIVGRPAQSSPT
jgi:hypothetical protein